LHAPQTAETAKIINASTLSLMKKDALLINTARGGLVDNYALAEALERGIIGGAGIDVLEKEPPNAEHPILRAPNCIITPHTAWASIDARKRLMNIMTENLRAFLNGTPQNVVNR
jgi:glycerate dehydrogenase